MKFSVDSCKLHVSEKSSSLTYTLSSSGGIVSLWKQDLDFHTKKHPPLFYMGLNDNLCAWNYLRGKKKNSTVENATTFILPHLKYSVVP